MDSSRTTYDLNGNLISEDCYTEKDSVVERTENSYNEYGDLVSTYYYLNDRPILPVTYQYEYDTLGNWITKDEYDYRNSWIYRTKREIIYY